MFYHRLFMSFLYFGIDCLDYFLIDRILRKDKANGLARAYPRLLSSGTYHGYLYKNTLTWIVNWIFR